MRIFAFIALLALLAPAAGRTEAVRNGNEFALAFYRADAAGKRALEKEYANRLLTFRFLRVIRIEEAAPGALPVYHTVEPSSDFIVILHPQGNVSQKVAATVVTNDCLAVNGRLNPLEGSTNTLVLKPAVLRSKDRAAPKGEKELLYEIDPTAVK